VLQVTGICTSICHKILAKCKYIFQSPWSLFRIDISIPNCSPTAPVEMGQIQQLFSPSLIQGHGSWLLPPSVRRQTRRWRWCISQDLIGLCQCERMKSSRVDVSIYEVWSYAEYICGYKYMHNRHAMKSYSKVVKGTTIRPIPRFCMFQKKWFCIFSLLLCLHGRRKKMVSSSSCPLSRHRSIEQWPAHRTFCISVIGNGYRSHQRGPRW